jgi:hypothetical protein
MYSKDYYEPFSEEVASLVPRTARSSRIAGINSKMMPSRPTVKFAPAIRNCTLDGTTMAIKAKHAEKSLRR